MTEIRWKQLSVLTRSTRRNVSIIPLSRLARNEVLYDVNAELYARRNEASVSWLAFILPQRCVQAVRPHPRSTAVEAALAVISGHC